MIVVTRKLTKTYGAVTALDSCSLGVSSGEVFGLLGPNGAGKTTLLRLLLGFLNPTSGDASVAGLDCRRQSVQVRRQVSYLPAEAALFPHMRGQDVLRFFCDVRPGGDFRRYLDCARRLELAELTRRVSYMSTGMKQKLALAAALAADVPLYILDEPTSNLDPNVRATVLAMVADLKREGRTVMFSSHVLPEVEEACDRVVILRAGQLVHTQVVAELRSQHRIMADLDGPLPPIPAGVGQVTTVVHRGNRVVIETPGELATLLGWLATLPLKDVRIEPVGLRAIYDRFHVGQVSNLPVTELGQVENLPHEVITP
ncbi:MAG: ABC transporter ATP-binding protein [Pirellulaceae bacterium]